MAAENHPTELQQDEINVQTTTTPKNDLISFENPPSTEIDELNQRIRNDLINYCSSFVEDDEEARLYMQRVWKKYLHYVGDVPMLSSFFDTLPIHVKKSALPRYQEEIMQWCNDLFRFDAHALLCSIYYSETFQRVIRFALKNSRSKKVSEKKAVIYVSTDFDTNLIADLTSLSANIKFEHIENDPLREDLIDVNRLEEILQRDSNDSEVYPAIVIANIGTQLMGQCDDLRRIKHLCERHDLWLHVIGNLLGSFAVLSTDTQEQMKMLCDSLTIDIMEMFGIQNLPYLTFFLRSTTDNQPDSITTHPLYDFILHSPSISFLTIWSISQRCSRDDILHHLKHSLDLSSQFLQRLPRLKGIRLINADDQTDGFTYKRIASGDSVDRPLPKLVVVFRFEPNDFDEVKDFPSSNQIDESEEFSTYIDLLNRWLFEKLSQEYRKMHLEILESVHFQQKKNDENASNRTLAHAIRFAPLDHALDDIENDDMQDFLNDLENYSEVLYATMTGRKNLSTIVWGYKNLTVVPLTNWAGVGAIRYVPDDIPITDESELDETTKYQIDSIQAELVRQLQKNDSAFSLGGTAEESTEMLYLRLGMIKRLDDIKILLQKIIINGREIEQSFKYVEHMAEKVKEGIEKVQKDLQDENLNLLAQGGILRQLPIVSNFMSWWSPPPSSTSSSVKGRSYDLNTGRIESTEQIYTHRMQIQKDSTSAQTHNDHDLQSTSEKQTETETT